VLALLGSKDRGLRMGWSLSNLGIVCCLGMASVGPDRGSRHGVTYGGHSLV